MTTRRSNAVAFFGRGYSVVVRNVKVFSLPIVTTVIALATAAIDNNCIVTVRLGRTAKVRRQAGYKTIMVVIGNAIVSSIRLAVCRQLGRISNLRGETKVTTLGLVVLLGVTHYVVIAVMAIICGQTIRTILIVIIVVVIVPTLAHVNSRERLSIVSI